MKHEAKIIMGLALALAAIAVTIDHIRHRLPAPAVTPDAPSAPGYGGRELQPPRSAGWRPSRRHAAFTHRHALSSPANPARGLPLTEAAWSGYR